VIRHIVVYRDNTALIDRQTLAHLTRRSVHTIRFRCPVAEYRDGKALYDINVCEPILDSIRTRRRVAA